MKRVTVVMGITILGLGAGFSRMGWAGQVMPDQENRNAQFIETSFRSICSRPTDPATLNYYLNALNEGTKTEAQVRADIETTCLRGAHMDACQHASALSDYCPSVESN